MLDEVIETVMEAFGWLVAAVADALAWLIEAIAGLFIEGACDFGALPLLMWAFVALGELVWWSLLAVSALLLALVLMRRPQAPARPRWWRPERRPAPSPTQDA